VIICENLRPKNCLQLIACSWDAWKLGKEGTLVKY